MNQVQNTWIKKTNLRLVTQKQRKISKIDLFRIKYKKSVCRICYCDDLEVDSPLINPCSCSGSMKYIHFSCLQTWLKQKIIIKSSLNDFCTNYTLKQIERELCKTVLPGNIKFNKIILNIRIRCMKYGILQNLHLNHL